jgi:hypothetical protein
MYMQEILTGMAEMTYWYCQPMATGYICQMVMALIPRYIPHGLRVLKGFM